MAFGRRLRRGLIEIGAILLIIGAVGAFQTRALPKGPAPGFVLQSLDGGVVRSEELRGKPTLLVFWAPWCGVCRLASQNVSWLRSWVGERANIVSIASHYENVAQVQAYVREQKVDYPVLLGGARTARAFGVEAYPTLFFLDESGTITRAVVGYTTTLGMYLRL